MSETNTISNASFEIMQARQIVAASWFMPIGNLIKKITDKDRKSAVYNHFLDISNSLALFSVDSDGYEYISNAEKDMPYLLLPLLPDEDSVSGIDLRRNSKGYVIPGDGPGDRPVMVLPYQDDLTTYESALVIDHEFKHCQDHTNPPKEWDDIPEKAKMGLFEWRAYTAGTKLMRLFDGEVLVDWIEDHAQKILNLKPDKIFPEHFSDFPDGTIIKAAQASKDGILHRYSYFAIQEVILERNFPPEDHMYYHAQIGNNFVRPSEDSDI